MLSEKKREIVRRSQAKRRANFKLMGLCRQCGAEPVPGKTLCPDCAEKQKKRQLKYAEKVRCSK